MKVESNFFQSGFNKAIIITIPIRQTKFTLQTKGNFLAAIFCL